MAKTKIIKLGNLLANTENFRFEALASQREAIELMINNQQEKLFFLAEDIIAYGLNPNDKIQVVQSNENKRKYIVLEGNRRTISLKLLDNPDLIDDPKFDGLRKKFRKLRRVNESKLIEEIECVVYDDPSEANKWIKLKHGGQNNGIGTVNWDSQQNQRFEELVEGKSSFALQAIKILKESNSTPNSIKKGLTKIKSTNINRLLTDPNVRNFLGLRSEKGILKPIIEQKEIEKGLIQIARDVLRKDFTVNNIYTKKDRSNYISNFPKKSVPNLSKPLSPDTTESKKGTSTSSSKSPRRRSIPTERKNIIPKRYSIAITNPRVNSIYDELKKLDINKFTNAAAVLFRVFVELSVDCYIEKNKLATIGVSAAKSGWNFQQKVNQVASHLQNLKKADDAILKGVKVSIKKKNDLMGIDTWHAYVHNSRFSPNAKDLPLIWDGMQDFITILWDNID